VRLGRAPEIWKAHLKKKKRGEKFPSGRSERSFHARKETSEKRKKPRRGGGGETRCPLPLGGEACKRSQEDIFQDKEIEELQETQEEGGGVRCSRSGILSKGMARRAYRL